MGNDHLRVAGIARDRVTSLDGSMRHEFRSASPA
jgi:hypothetical protein